MTTQTAISGYRTSAFSLRGSEMLDGPVAVEVAFFLPRGKTVKRKQPAVKPDLDKLVRAVLDALTGYCYKDDGQVVRVVAVKEYADGQHTGCELIVRQMQEG